MQDWVTRALEGRSKAERVADALEEQIRTLGLTSGAFLGTKGALRVQLAVSPATLDTALGVLTDRGLVEIRPGVKGGVRVAGSAPSLLMGRTRRQVQGPASDALRAGQALALYLALQSHVVARAIPKATADDRKALRAARTRLNRSIGDMQAFNEAHMLMHYTMLDATHDDVLAMAVQGLMAIMHAATGPSQPPPSEDIGEYTNDRVAGHVAVIDAVLARDLQAAWVALLGHGITPADVAADAPMLPEGALEHESQWRRGFTP